MIFELCTPDLDRNLLINLRVVLLCTIEEFKTDIIFYDKISFIVLCPGLEQKNKIDKSNIIL